MPPLPLQLCTAMDAASFIVCLSLLEAGSVFPDTEAAVYAIATWLLWRRQPEARLS